LDSFDGAETNLPPFRGSAPATPGELAGIRRTFRAWLGEADLDEPALHELLLILHEAAARAIQVAQPSDLVGLEAILLNDQVTIIVTGPARTATDVNNADGLRLIHELVHDCVVSQDGSTLTIRYSLGPR
jgi:anti-sigma regulatory factor (Ser/Thr protein kinase)